MGKLFKCICGYCGELDTFARIIMAKGFSRLDMPKPDRVVEKIVLCGCPKCHMVSMYDNAELGEECV